MCSKDLTVFNSFHYHREVLNLPVPHCKNECFRAPLRDFLPANKTQSVDDGDFVGRHICYFHYLTFLAFAQKSGNDIFYFDFQCKQPKSLHIHNRVVVKQPSQKLWTRRKSLKLNINPNVCQYLDKQFNFCHEIYQNGVEI